VWETIKEEELERGMYRTDEPDLSAELDKARVRVNRIDNEHAVEVKQLSQWVVRISNIMFDLGLLPIQDIPQLPEVSAGSLVGDRHLEALARGAGLRRQFVGPSLGQLLCL
jgi:hypothetical protein